MQFALVNNERAVPSVGLVGACPACGSVMIPKCGNQRVHHWAHRGERSCDSWWERETEWHRGWKGKFPTHWQEVIRHDDASGEKHIADVCTEHGLTVEFQHSPLKPGERMAREKFYGSVTWVVDGSRLKRDLPRFLKGISSSRPVSKNGPFITSFPREMFPDSWVDCAVPVFFDFDHAVTPSDEAVWVTRPLWCLLPGRVRGRAVVLKLSREAFVSGTLKGQQLQTQEIMENAERLVVAELMREHQSRRVSRF